MGAVLAVVLGVLVFFAALSLVRWIILGRIPQGMALLGREVEALRERVAQLEAEVRRQEQTPQ